MNGSFQCLKLAGRPGRDAKWKEGGTGLKAEMGKEGSSRAAAAAEKQHQRGRLERATAAARVNQPKTD
jgi:hypothetical protein